MAARRLWILSLLAGLFAMHGVLYVGAGSGVHSPATAISEHVMAASFADILTFGASPSAVDRHETGHTAAIPFKDHASLPGTSGHGVGAHALSMCVAVLLAGLALLAAALAVRRAAPALVGNRDMRPRRPWRAFTLPRPPDLSALCLLRI